MSTYETNDPDRIRADIEQTRYELSNDVDALRDKVSPGNAVRRQRVRMRHAVTGVKDRVMGVAEDAQSRGQSTVSSVGETAAHAPTMVRERTEGNPLAAGLVAFGVGWLASTVIPASSAERRAATALKEQAEPVKREVTEAAKQVVDDLREPAQEAVESVKSTASDAAGNVKDEGSSAAQDVRSEAQAARHTAPDERTQF